VIYLDHNAATPLSEAVLAAVEAAHRSAWANPSSVHAAGRAARALVERTRRTLALPLNVQPADIVLTGGGTEACNLGVLGLARRGRVITSALEHPAVLAAVQQLDPAPTLLPLVDGVPAPGALASALRDDTALVALQWVNHETGAISPVQEYARLCRERGVPLFIDGCQALGKVSTNLAEVGATAVAFAASKVGGPAGAGALWVERGRDLRPHSFGGPQERGRRAGSPDTAALGGFAVAAEAMPARLAERARLLSLRDRLEQACVQLGAQRNAPPTRVDSVTNVSFRGWRSAILIAALDVEGLCASAGAACSSGVDTGSPVLAALYPDEPWRAGSALRLSLGPETSEQDVDGAIQVLQKVLGRAA
jgi:cysteine desulfurase